MHNQMKKNIEHDMEAGSIWGFTGIIANVTVLDSLLP